MTEIIHAGDPDDEGQLLVDEVPEYAGNTKPVKRVLINDNTLPAVKKALANPKITVTSEDSISRLWRVL